MILWVMTAFVWFLIVRRWQQADEKLSETLALKRQGLGPCPEPIPGEKEGQVLRTPWPLIWGSEAYGWPGYCSPIPRTTPCPPRIALLLKISKQPLTTRSLQPTRRQSFTLCRTSHSQPNLRSQALRHFYNITLCLAPSFPCALLCTRPLHSDQCEEAKLSPTERKEWTLTGPPAPLTARLSQPHSLFILTLLLQHRSQRLSRNIARTSSCACDNPAPSYNQPSFVLSSPSTQPLPTSQHHTPSLSPRQRQSPPQCPRQSL